MVGILIKKMCQFALEKFDNILNKIDSLLETYNITLEHNQMYILLIISYHYILKVVLMMKTINVFSKRYYR